MMVALIPPIPVAIKTQSCAVSRGSAVMAITGNRRRIGHPVFVEAVLRSKIRCEPKPRTLLPAGFN